MSEFSPELTRAIEDYELRVSPDLKTVTGRLKYGIGVIDDEMHHDFAMHLLRHHARPNRRHDPARTGRLVEAGRLNRARPRRAGSDAVVYPCEPQTIRRHGWADPNLYQQA